MAAPLPARIKRWALDSAHYGTIALFALFAAFPFFWMVITTFKETRDLLDTENNPFIYNMPPTMENLRVLFQDTLFPQWIWNTAWVGVAVVAVTLLLSVPAGYALARLSGKWAHGS